MAVKTIKMGSELIGYDGSPVLDSNGRPMTMEKVCVLGLALGYESNATGEEKYKRHCLMSRLHGREDGVELDDSDIAIIKRSVGIWGGPAVVGPVWDTLDGK